MLDHPGSAIAGLSLILKFGFDPIYSYIAIYILPFWLEIAYSRPFWGSFWTYFPQIWSPIVLTPKRIILARKHVV